MSRSAFVFSCALLASCFGLHGSTAQVIPLREQITRVTTNRSVIPQIRKAFAFPSAGITFDTDFDGARLSAVTSAGGGAFTLLVDPENHPVNDSGWYAFRVRAETNTTIQVTLTYRRGPHRYVPKLSHDRVQWLELQTTGTRGSNDSFTFSVEVGPRPLFVSGQELITSNDMDLWLSSLRGEPYVKSRLAGHSVEGKPLRIIEVSEATEKADLVFILGRQHPPEVTGTMALQAFISTLCADTPEARAFRKRYCTVVFPMVNPDGVDAGHWRHNARGADLNRDWGQFNQAETAAISAEMRRLASGRRVMLGIDFHGTREDVFYTTRALGLENDTGIRWLEHLQQLAPEYHVRVQGANPAGSLRTYSSASWMRKTFDAPAITYEVGDKTDRTLIRRIGERSAVALMQVLTQKPARAPIMNRKNSGADPSGVISVALFKGPGVSGAGPGRIASWFKGSNRINVKEISGSEIQAGSLTNYDLVIFPGGSASAQAKAIGEDGKAAVREYLRRGGGYIGICAGAYLACSGFPWAVQVLDAKTVSPKWERGGGMVRLQLTSEGSPILRGPAESVPVKYENGPILMPAGDPDIDDYVSLALFATEIAENDSPKGIMAGSPAAVAGTFGDGRVVCFSPHPEQTVGLEKLVEEAILWVAKEKQE